MTTSRDKPLSDWTDDEIEQSRRAVAPTIAYSYDMLTAERERRAAARQSRLALGLTIAATTAAAIAAIAAAVAACVSLARP